MALLDTLLPHLAESIGEAGLQDVKVIRVESQTGSEPEDLQWYCGKPSLESVGHFFLGATQETWKEIGGTSESLLGRCLEKTLDGHPQAARLVTSLNSSDAPNQDRPRIALEITHSTGVALSLHCVVSPDLEAAFDGIVAAAPASQAARRSNSVDMLAHVQVPVSVSFGGTQIRMKDLLNLATGSVVELDQSMNDSVEIRVNDCVIARGEVVAVDGSYAVRVLEMVSDGMDAGKTARI